MQRWGIVLVFILGSYLISPALPPAQADTPEIVINELAWAGSSLGSTDEWIELYNPAGEERDISGWILTKNTSGVDAPMVTLPPDTHIDSDGYFLIARLSADSSVLSIEPNLVTSSITLSNSALLIKLFKGPIDNPDNLVDTAGSGGVPPAGNNSTKSSMERSSDLTGWHGAGDSVNLDAGVIDLATPGATNSEPVMVPTITSVSPTEGYIDTVLELTEIHGTNFSVTPPPTVSIERSGITVTATNVTLDDSEMISSADVTTEGLEPGTWKLIVTNPGGLSAELPEAITLTSPPAPQDLTTTVRINELYPRPSTTSNDEYIELYNFGDKAVNLAGWKLDDIADGGSAPFTFASQNIPAKGFVTIYKPDSHITLNDSGDTVTLIQPNGFQLDSTTYTTAPAGSTWARFDTGFKWTLTPTPAKSNSFSELPGAEPETPTTDEPDDSPASYPSGTVIINEVYPNPKIGDEFIELRNTSPKALDLTGWKLQDAAGKSYVIKSEAIQIQSLLGSGDYAVINSSVSHIPLNNSGGETLSLFDGSGKLISQMHYPDKAPADAAYAWDGTAWWWTPTPTPGRNNEIEIAEVQGTVAGEVTLPGTLPVTGNSARRAIGIFMMVGSGGAMIFWYRKNASTHHHHN